MKTISTIAVILFSLSLFGQEAGKAGELLRNDAKGKELQSPRSNSSERKQGNTLDHSHNRQVPSRNDSKQNSTNNYRWNYNYGNSEVFLRVPLSGYYTIEVGGQAMSNSTGKFRFFDLPSGIVPIAIYENNYLVYRTSLRLQNHTRLLLDFFPNMGLYLLGNYAIPNNAYGVNQWDDIWNQYYGNQTGNYHSEYYGNMMNDQEFNRFMYSVKNSGNFDKDKMAIVTMTAKNANFTAQQIYSLLKTLDFDNSKLQMGKILYPKCVNRQDSYVILEAFEFGGWRNQMAEYISNFR